MWSAGLKVMNFQFRTEPIRLFNISNFRQVVKDELAVLQQPATDQLTAETHIIYDILLQPVCIYFRCYIILLHF